ncbi:hypothetical protein MJ1_0058 [Nanobdella aerobiophila]|uniref:Uncharacterized protein n=1 Tax=Nanobdella aerobiophila TaxID=2586965 RepID=A0A915WSI5_9ARCH|nr:hypothetical protein [Nanobdella aerobiophila]BBL45237.1 hypothetical protein MJ1_0058 [Nanobdella aerobiophila]
MILKFIIKDMYTKSQILLYMLIYFILIYSPILISIYFLNLYKIIPKNIFPFLYISSSIGALLWISFILILTNIFFIIINIYSGNKKINLYGNIVYTKTEIDFILSSDLKIDRYILLKSLSFLIFIYFIILPFFFSYIYQLYLFHQLNTIIILITILNSLIYSYIISLIVYLPSNIIKKTIYSIFPILLIFLNIFYYPEINILLSKIYFTPILSIYLIIIYLISGKDFYKFYTDPYSIYNDDINFIENRSIFRTKDPIKDISNSLLKYLIIFSSIISILIFIFFYIKNIFSIYIIFLLLYSSAVGLELSIGFERVWVNAGNYYFMNYIRKKMNYRLNNSYKILLPFIISFFILFILKNNIYYIYSIYSIILLPISINIPSWYYSGKLNPQYKGYSYDRQFTRLDIKNFLSIIILSIYTFIDMAPLFINNIIFSSLSFLILLLIFSIDYYNKLNNKNIWYKFIEDLITNDYS